jgi:ubiquitin-protein ligase
MVTAPAVKRILKDVRSITRSPLESQGIYYVHDDTDILRGLAMIVGPEGTVYQGGYYFFEISYPPNYPHAPPAFKFYTNDGIARMHPNLYKSGKVCLSVLNTWRGEGWTSCQTISSVLLTVCSVLCPLPLLNEPGVPDTHRDMIPYDTIVAYKNFHLSIAEMLTEGSSSFPLKFSCFLPKMRELFVSGYGPIAESAMAYGSSHPEPVTLETAIYKMSVRVDFPGVQSRLADLYSALKTAPDVTSNPPLRNKKISQEEHLTAT